ncbi:MAG: hypothetical protein NC418_06490 [Muribaculaceae bacterium]|nr:hypothetical protein [Muribaculaceae bacterium]
MRRQSSLILILLLALPSLLAWAASQRTNVPRIAPTIPTADRSAGNKVFLERADVLKKQTSDSFMILVGDVLFTKGPMIMKCDSCHYYPETESMSAFGNVSMEQGDTLFVYADELQFDGTSEIATLYADPGKKVRLINRDVKLETDIFIYDLAIDLGYYEVGGTLTDPSNTLTSIYGEYAPSTKEANFYTRVHLNSRNTSDTLDIYSDTLYYNTASHIAELLSPSTVVNARGTIYTSLGVYDTDGNKATLFDRSTVVTSQGQTLTADTIFYDRGRGFGECFGAMVLTDTAHSVEVLGDYGYYNELTDSTFITGRALLKQYADSDTLWLHGRYIESFRSFDTTFIAEDTAARRPASTVIDTSHIAVVYPRVRFYRRDMQGLCDSMRFTQADSMLRMYVNPVVWSDDQQIFGKIIALHLNDSTIEEAILPENGFAAQHIEGEHYNQISGKEMKAFFEGGEMRRLDISGNVEIIMYPEESDSTINKIVNAQSSFLTATFRGRTTEYIKLWPETTGAATPLFLAKKSSYYLPKFKWFDGMRPTGPADVFIIPPAMEELMTSSGRSSAIDKKPASRIMLHERPDGAEPPPAAAAQPDSTDQPKSEIAPLQQ